MDRLSSVVEELASRSQEEVRERMRKLDYIDLRAEIKRFIEERIREEELQALLDKVDRLLSSVEAGGEAAWRSIREDEG